MVNAVPMTDEETIAITVVPSADIDYLMQPVNEEEARRAVQPLKRRVTDYVTLYHPDPDNSYSVYIVPMNATDRRTRLTQLLSETKVIGGKRVQWNNARPVVATTEQPLRCFVAGCLRAGGFTRREQLIGHVRSKHPDEVPMYQKIIDKLIGLAYLDIPKEQWALYGLDVEDMDVEDEKPARRGRKPREEAD